jgi:hypothetical protein
VKSLSERGGVAPHRIVHFAIHGALAASSSAFAEPGLILTPPPKVPSTPRRGRVGDLVL